MVKVLCSRCGWESRDRTKHSDAHRDFDEHKCEDEEG